jgi:membrane-associated phospholipid phosphatase
MRRAALVAAATAYAALAVLVSQGQVDVIDSYAARNLMPFSSAHHDRTTPIEHLLAYEGTGFHPGRVLRLPASALLSSLLLLAGCALLWRRGRKRLAFVWIGAFALANAVELGSKLAITKPALYTMSHGVLEPVGLQSSFPSGHALRAALLVGIFASLWPIVTPLLLIWLAGVAVTLELDGIHAPSDIVGGLLLASIAILAVAMLAPDRKPSVPPAGQSERLTSPREVATESVTRSLIRQT